MRSSLGAPHSTERCKITNFPQRRQIFSAFSIGRTPHLACGKPNDIVYVSTNPHLALGKRPKKDCHWWMLLRQKQKT